MLRIFKAVKTSLPIYYTELLYIVQEEEIN